MSETNVKLEHKRQEFKAIGRHPEIEEALETAVQWTAVQFGGPNYIKWIKTPLTLCGKTAAALMQRTQSDRPILFLPAEIARARGQAEQGCVITFPDRVLLAWTEGKLRLTYFAHLLYSSTITNVAEQSPYVVRFDTDDRWTVHIDKLAFAQPDFMPPLLNTLNGVPE